MAAHPITKTTFATPPIAVRPWTRWWWPGGDVEMEELLREVDLLADTFFGGVEIQPFTAGINPATRNDHTSAIYAYDSPEYYAKLQAVLEAAQRRKLTVDLTIGSGWPPGGPFVPLADNTDTLLYGEATITRAVDMPVPPPIMPFAYAVYSPDSVLPLLKGREWTQTLAYRPEHARLLSVVAAKVVDNGRSPDPSVLTDTVLLDVATATDITAHVQSGHVQWTPPDTGPWQIIALYTMPSGSRTLLSAVSAENYAVDPLDTDAIARYFDNWIGRHPELLAHAGKTLRALFGDSFEFFPQRHFADDLLEMFRAHRGYDPTPFLPAVFQPARDQHFFFFSGLRAAPDFSFGDVSPRIIYDYDLTVSDLFFKHWYPAARTWIEAQGLAFRQQGYNPPLDVMRAAGAATIPETEGGNENTLKRVTSGGHLYGRPIISAESFVFLPKGGFAMTPQDYKQGIDLLMTSGVNQLIYHGTPYRWPEPGYGEIGWSPFISPFGPTNISTNISEADPFWAYQADINVYAARVQLLMQAGAPDADWLVYLPVFHNPEDAAFQPVLDTLNATGRTWEWVNDDLLAQAEWRDDGLHIGAMAFQGLVLPDIQALPVTTADAIATLARAGLPVGVYGRVPAQQPGFFNFEENDRAVATWMQDVVAQPACAVIDTAEALAQFIEARYTGPISYTRNGSLRAIRRALGDGRRLAFLRNTTAQATEFTLVLDASLHACYWLDAVTGKIHAATPEDNTLTGRLAGHGALAVLAGPRTLFTAEELSPGNPAQPPAVLQSMPLPDWRLEIAGEDVPGGAYVAEQRALGDWCARPELVHVSSPGTYTGAIRLDELRADARYVLDLGELHGAAAVIVNGHAVGHAVFAPYRLDVTDYLHAGENTVRIEVTPPLRNRLLGKARRGDPEYAQFAAPGPFGPAKPIPSGLAGPVTLQVCR